MTKSLLFYLKASKDRKRRILGYFFRSESLEITPKQFLNQQVKSQKSNILT